MKGLVPLAWVLGCVALCAALTLGYRRVPAGSPLALEDVRVEGLERTDVAAVLRAAGLGVGGSVLSVDVDRVRQAVEALPWVRRARVLRQMPSGLRIEVEEWVPRHLVRLDKLYYLTGEGHVVRTALDRGRDYAVVTGLTAAQLEAPGPLRDALLELMAALDRGELADEPGEIHVDAAQGFTLYTPADGGAGIRLGFGDFDGKFERLKRLRRHLEKRGQAAYAVNLSHDDKIIARLVSPAEGKATHP